MVEVEYDKTKYVSEVNKFHKLGHSVVYGPCIHCGEGDFMHLYYGDNSKVYRTCDFCYTIERL